MSGSDLLKAWHWARRLIGGAVIAQPVGRYAASDLSSTRGDRRPQADEGVYKTCPKCGRTLVFLKSDTDWEFYCCLEHGTVVMAVDNAERQSTLHPSTDQDHHTTSKT